MGSKCNEAETGSVNSLQIRQRFSIILQHFLKQTKLHFGQNYLTLCFRFYCFCSILISLLRKVRSDFYLNLETQSSNFYLNLET